jgi:hypothetical protein
VRRTAAGRRVAGTGGRTRDGRGGTTVVGSVMRRYAAGRRVAGTGGTARAGRGGVGRAVVLDGRKAVVLAFIGNIGGCVRSSPPPLLGTTHFPYVVNQARRRRATNRRASSWETATASREGSLSLTVMRISSHALVRIF